jgi:nitrate reductase gamma subunit
MSFVAYPLSVMLGGNPAALAAAYGWAWWGHAGLAALLVAWIPFGKMRHIFAAPLSLLLNRERA